MTQLDTLECMTVGDATFCTSAPSEISVTPAALFFVESDVKGSEFTFHFANGELTYRVKGWDALIEALILERVDG